MKKISAVALALLIAGTASMPALARMDKDSYNPRVKDPDTGVTLHAPRHDETASANSTAHRFSEDVRLAMHRLANATRRVVHRADDELHRHHTQNA